MSRVMRVLVIAAMAAIALAGCQKQSSPGITSAWPVATSERVVPQPPAVLRWPFTGKEATDPDRLALRPLSVKIENSDSSRPQIGLNAADVVYETIVEGGITRFNCIFHSKVPEIVGPVRSARLSDKWVVPQYDGLLFFSGRSASVGAVLRKYEIPDLEHGRASSAYFRTSDRSAPHNLLLRTSKCYEVAKDRGYRVTSKAKALAFDRRSVDATPVVTTVKIPFSQANRVEWRYDEDSRMYRRWNNGRKHIDQATGKQVSTRNVVVMWAKYTEATQDMVGSVTWDIMLKGEGRATILRDGQRYNVTWTAAKNAPPQFTDEDGKQVKLASGRTWFQVIRLDGKMTMK